MEIAEVVMNPVRQRIFSRFLSEINEIALRYMKAEATESSKTRQITLISSPMDM